MNEKQSHSSFYTTSLIDFNRAHKSQLRQSAVGKVVASKLGYSSAIVHLLSFCATDDQPILDTIANIRSMHIVCAFILYAII